MAGAPQTLCVGRILGPHGVRGEVRLRSFTADPADVAAYAPLTSPDGARSFRIANLRPVGSGPDMFVARIEGVGDREAAQTLAGLDLHAPRDRIGAGLAPDEFLHADLLGLEARTPDGRAVGRVASVQNFGAGDLIEIALSGGNRTEFVPFSRAHVPVVDLAGGCITVASDPTATMADEPGGASPGSRPAIAATTAKAASPPRG